METNSHPIAYGNEQFPLKIDSISLPCFVLNNKQRVFKNNGVQKALGYDGKSDLWLLELLKSIQKFYAIDTSIIAALENPIYAKIDSVSLSNEKSACISSEMVLLICQTILTAKKQGYLSFSQLKYANAAEKIFLFCKDRNLDELVDRATGYDFLKEKSKENLRHFYSKNLNDSAFEWVQTFPDNLFENLLAVYQLDWFSLEKDPNSIAKVLFDIVFSRISNETLEELRISKPKRSYKAQTNKQKDNQHPKLKEHIINILNLLKVSDSNWNIFLQLLNKAYPKNPNFAVPFPKITSEIEITQPLSTFNGYLVKVI